VVGRKIGLERVTLGTSKIQMDIPQFSAFYNITLYSYKWNIFARWEDWCGLQMEIDREQKLMLEF
jgi:hypothetical protein